MATDKQDPNFESLIKDVKSNIKTRLGDLMSKLLNSAEDALFELAESAENNEAQNRAFELMRQLKQAKPVIAGDFIIKIAPYLRPYTVTEAEKQKASMEMEDELSLVDKSEVEDMVMVKNIGERAAGKYREQLSHLEARLEHLALKTDDIFAKDALKPINFCQAFDDSLGDDFDIESKKILFEMFNDEVASKLDSLYDSINNRLIDSGILPQIKLHANAANKKRRHSDPPPMQEGELPPDEMPPEDPQSYGNYAMTAPPGGSFGGYRAPGAMGGQAGSPYAQAGMPPDQGTGTAPGQPGASGTGGMPGLTGAPYSQGAQGGAGAEASGGAAEGNYTHYTAGMPANQVSQVLGQFFGLPIARSSDQGDPSEPNSFAAHTASTPQFYGHNEILTALSHVQAAPQFAPAADAAPEELKFDADAIKTALLEDIAKESGGAVTKRINQIAEKTIDFIELIFDAIIDDEEISDTIKALLLRLQIPVIKASMVDQEFFIYDDHPARVLLDKIADVGVGVTDHTDEVYIRLDKIVTNLVSEFDLQTSTFQKALDDLNAFIDELEGEARRKEEEAQRQVLREHARNTVLKALRNITSGKVLPEAVHPIVLKRWPTLMFNHYLEHGKENDEWINIIEILRQIVESVQTIVTAEDLAHLQSTQGEMVNSIREYMSRTNQSKKDIDTVIQGLTDTHQNMIDNTDFSQEQIEEAEEVIAEQVANPPEPEPQETEQAEPKPELPSNIMPGMWFRVYMGEDTGARRCKLSVIIVEDSKLVFVNHNGEIVVEKSFEEFNKELEDEMSTVIMGHSVFDHALNSVITKLAPV